MVWYFDDEPFIPTEDYLKKFEGFVYLITNLTNGKRYIGRKYLFSIRKVKNKTKRQRSNSDWMEYWSSSNSVKEDIEILGKDNFKREILVLCKTRGDTNRMEEFYQWKYNVLENDNWYNDSIGKMKGPTERIIEGRIYSKNVENFGD